MKWLITGGCGFIGTSLIKQLLTENNHSVRVVDNLSTGTREDLANVCEFTEHNPADINDSPNGVELIVGDILDEQLSNTIVKGCDVIVHLAANTGVGPSVENPRADCYANVIGTFNYLEAARKNNIDRFIFASSGAPAGEVDPPIHEEIPAHPVSPYGASKLAGEGYCSAYKNSFGINTVALRFGNVYGPGSVHKDSVVAKFLRRAINGEILEIYGDGGQTRDFIFIDDLISAILLAAVTPNVGGEIFQIATSSETTINEMVENLVLVLNKKDIHDIEIKNSETRIGDVKRNFSDTRKALSILGWKPEVDLSRGLELTVDYFLKTEASE